MAHKIHYVPGPVSAVVSNDWFINLKIPLLCYKNIGGGQMEGGLLVNLVPMLEQKKKKKKTMRKGTFFQAGQCAALSSFRVRWHFSRKRVGILKSDK